MSSNFSHITNPKPVIIPVSDRLFYIADNITKTRNQFLVSQTSAHMIDKRRFISDVAKLLFKRKVHQPPVTEKSLRMKEAEIGASLFGGTTTKKHIMFFHEDRANWYFYQGIIDVVNSKQTTESLTLHYEVRQNDILRIDNNKGKIGYMILNGQELKNFLSAVEMYYRLVMGQLYNIDVTADKTLQQPL